MCRCKISASKCSRASRSRVAAAAPAVSRGCAGAGCCPSCRGKAATDALAARQVAADARA